MHSVIVTATGLNLQQSVQVRSHTFIADEPASNGGDDAGPAPHELLVAALGTCTSITLQLYAKRKAWNLGTVEVSVDGHRDGEVYRIQRRIRFGGSLTEDQRSRLLEIANHCPVHRTLVGEIQIETALATGASGSA
jgi:putative redox protein